MKRANQGFTLIELMIVIAILGILLAIAIPSYRDYTIRSRVSEGLRLSVWAKFAVDETFQNSGAVPDQASTGFSFPGSTSFVSDISIASDGTGAITINTQNTGASPDVVFILEPTLAAGAPVQWNCRTVQGETSHVPTICRN